LGQPIEVTARFDRGGKAIPTEFVRNGVSFPVVSVGRRWREADGEHILVMVSPDDSVHELLYTWDEGRWELVKSHVDPRNRMV
jgi:hypothetical protein